MRDTSHRDTLQSGFQRNVKLRITQAIKLKPRSVDGRRCIIFQLLAARYPSSTRSWEEMLGRCLSRESHAREQKRRSGGKRARSDSLTRRGSEDRIVGKSEQRVTYGSRYGSAAELMLRPRMRFRTRLRLVIGHNRKLRLRCNAITKWQTGRAIAATLNHAYNGTIDRASMLPNNSRDHLRSGDAAYGIFNRECCL
jgi:hypothetical protein